MLSREVHTSLRGRGMATVIRPFSFREFLRHRGEEPAAGGWLPTPAERSLVEKRFREYLVEGGFPETQGLPIPSGSISFKAMSTRFSSATWSSATRCRRWPRSAGSCVNASATPPGASARTGSTRTSRPRGTEWRRTRSTRCSAICWTLSCSSAVTLATESERKRNSNPRKLYPADPGLIRAFDASGRANLGHSLETAVLNELERRGAEVGLREDGRGPRGGLPDRHPVTGEELIQVCADARRGDAGTRATRSRRRWEGAPACRAPTPRARPRRVPRVAHRQSRAACL